MLIKLLAVSLAAVSAGRALAAEPKEELVAAVKKLAEAPNYSWSTKVEGGFSAGAGEGRTQKDGTSRLRVALGDDTYDVVIRDGKGAAKGAGGWASAAELNRDADEDSANFSAERFLASTIANFKTPAAQALELCEGVSSVHKDGEAFIADLPADAVKRLLATLRRRSATSGQQVEVNEPVGSLKCTVRDGRLAKIEIHVQGSVKFNGNERKIDRTTITEIRNVGRTRVEVPEEAKAKL